MTKIPVRVWVATPVLATVLTIAYQIIPEIVIGFFMIVSFVISLAVLVGAFADYMDKK
jgi:hypothetical protein